MCRRCEPNDCDCGNPASDLGDARDAAAELSQRRMNDDDQAPSSCACARGDFCERCHHYPASDTEERAARFA